jgi:hypothetical protein
MSFASLSHLEESPLPDWLMSTPEVQQRLRGIARNVRHHGVSWREVHRECAACSAWITQHIHPLSTAEVQGLTQFFYGIVAQQCCATGVISLQSAE